MFYSTTANNKLDENNVYVTGHTMSYSLTSNEAIFLRWDNIGKYHHYYPIADAAAYAGTPPMFSNGMLIYTPALDDPKTTLAGIITPYGRPREFQAASRDGFSSVTLRMAVPYVIVSATVRGLANKASLYDGIVMSVSSDGTSWTTEWIDNAQGTAPFSLDLSSYFDTKAAIYSYIIRFDLYGSKYTDVSISDLSVESDFQIATKSLPSFSSGLNTLILSRSGSDLQPMTVRVGFNSSGKPVAISNQGQFHSGAAMFPYLIGVSITVSTLLSLRFGLRRFQSLSRYRY